MRIISLFLTSIILLAVIGCGKKPEETLVEKAIQAQFGDNAKIEISEDSVSIKSEDGKALITAGKGATIPKDFPSDIYVYPKSGVEATIDMPTGKMVTLISSDDVGTIAAAYKKEMSSKGWKEQTSMNVEGQHVLILQKDERAINITIIKDDKTGGSRIALMMTQ